MSSRMRAITSTDSSRGTAALAGVVSYAGAGEVDRLVPTIARTTRARVEDMIVDGPIALGHIHGGIHRRGDLVCAFEGRLANHSTLERSLGLASETPPGRIVEAAYRRWGQAAPERLRGGFVFAVWDRTRSQGLLACDALGARSLFFHSTGSQLVFATELAAVLQILPTRPEVDDRTVLQWIAFGTAVDDQTLYTGVHRLRSGALLTFDRVRLSQRSYWRPRYQPPLRIAPEEAALEVRRRLRDTVAERLQCRDRAGILLSGGLDSSMVAAAAREAAPALDLTGYSMTFPDLPAVDESRLVQTVCHQLDVACVQMRVRGGSLLAGGIRFLERWGLPTPAPNITFITALQDFAAREGTTLMLDGEGGDELFGTDSFLLGHLVRRGRLLTAWNICRDLPGLGEHPSTAATSRAFWTLAVHGALPAGFQRLRGSLPAAQQVGPSWLSESAADSLRSAYDPLSWRRRRAPLWWSHLSHVLTAGREQIQMFDCLRQIGVTSGLERHHPLLDRELVELILRLPPEYAFRNRLDRAVQRDAMRSLIPDAIVDRPEKSFFTPLLRNSLLRGELAIARSLLESPTAEIHKFVDRRALGACLNAIGSGGGSAAVLLYTWRLTMMECWLRWNTDADFTSRYLSEMVTDPLRVDFARRGPAGVRGGRRAA